MRSAKPKALTLLLGAALALALVALAGAIGPGFSEAQEGTMQNCPQPGKWAISVWSGEDDTDTGQALATCGEEAVDLAYYIDPQSQQWLRYFVGRAEVSNLLTVDDMQGVLARGAMAAVQPTPTPTPTLSPTPTPTAVAAGDVVLVSSNAFTRTMSLTIDGEDRELTVVGELKNDSSSERSPGEITIRFYDAADQEIGLRKTFAFGGILQAGRTTAFHESLPSIIYWETETNDYPEDWARYEIALSPRDPYDWEDRPVDIAVEDVQVTDGGRHVTGNAVNASSKTVDKYGVDVYVIYYQADGTILNARQDSGINSEPLAPGESAPFDISFLSGEPVDFSSYVVQGYAEAE